MMIRGAAIDHSSLRSSAPGPGMFMKRLEVLIPVILSEYGKRRISYLPLSISRLRSLAFSPVWHEQSTAHQTSGEEFGGY